MIERGEADFIVSFDKLEAARWLPCLKEGGRIIVNTQQIDPMPVITGAAVYPEGILDEINADIDAVDALKVAKEAGSVKAVNIVLMARLAKYIDIPYEKWIDAIEKTVKPAFAELNKAAFEMGYNS